MAWIYLAESAVSASHSKSGSSHSRTVKSIGTHKRSCFQECHPDNCRERRSGMTSEPCFLIDCRRLSTLFPADSPARTSALLEMARAWRVSGQDFFSRSYDLLAIYDPAWSFWKMSQLSLLVEESELLQSLPSYGMTVGGQLFQPQTLEPSTSAKDGGYLPTPTTLEGGWNKSASSGSKIRPSLGMMARKNLWPTPRASDGVHGGPNQRDSKGNMALPAAVVWRTPNATDHKSRGDRKAGQQVQLQTQVGGQLSPMWTEWLMGYPIGWTELKDWATQWFRSKRGKRSCA